MKLDYPAPIKAAILKQWLHDGSEIALLDIREHGQYGEEHLFYIVSIPYSRLEIEINRLVPNKNVRIVLVGDEAGVLSTIAYKRLSMMGYQNIHMLEGGMKGWKLAGYEVFAGVNLPSKAFGELAEHVFNTPRISATELNKRIEAKDDLVILDGRPFTEYKKMSIPTAICCPNGELPLRIDEIVQSPDTTIVINCAGRTRSIIGAQTLINLGVPNKVLALENGTQGWYLEDLTLEHGQTRKYPDQINTSSLSSRQVRSRALAEKHGVQFIDAATVNQWQRDKTRTTFLCDVRTPEEFALGTIPGAQHTPGGQLVQATDQYIGIKGARLVLIDNEGVRAPAMASWLAMLGWDVAVWKDAFMSQPSASTKDHAVVEVRELRAQSEEGAYKEINVNQIPALLNAGVVLIDIRPSMKYRESHIQKAIWSIRPKLFDLADILRGQAVVLVAEDIEMAKLAALDLSEIGVKEININAGPASEWVAANLKTEATPNAPADEECIDYLFFVHDRHDGNKAAARQYLAWEINLLAQIDEQEKNAFRLPH